MFMGSSQNFIELIQYWMIRKNNYLLSSTFSFCFWNKALLFINFTFSISESTWCSLYPRFTNHSFKCLRRLLSFSRIKQILLSFLTCLYAIDFLYTLRWHDCTWKYWCVSFGLHYKSVSNLSIVVEKSMVNLIFRCGLFIQLKSPLIFWNLESIYKKSHQGILTTGKAQTHCFEKLSFLTLP